MYGGLFHRTPLQVLSLQPERMNFSVLDRNQSKILKFILDNHQTGIGSPENSRIFLFCIDKPNIFRDVKGSFAAFDISKAGLPFGQDGPGQGGKEKDAPIWGPFGKWIIGFDSIEFFSSAVKRCPFPVLGSTSHKPIKV